MITIDRLSEILSELSETLTNSVTPYGAHKVVNAALGTQLPPQMFYNYCRKGFITAAKVEIDGKDVWKIEPDSLIAFVDRYAMKNLVTALPTN